MSTCDFICRIYLLSAWQSLLLIGLGVILIALVLQLRYDD